MQLRPARTDVVVIGGGLAGLAAARKLARAGLSVRIVEARERLGGRAHTLDLGHGVLVDEGCSYVHGMHFNPLKPIFESIGVKLVPNGAEEGQHVYQRGRALEPERARRISEAAMGTFFGTSRETNLNAAMPPDGSSIADFARYVFDGLGRDADAARMCLEAMSGWTGADLDDVALRWWGFEQDHTGTDALVEGGYSQLVRWLEAEVGDHGGLVDLGDPVIRIAQHGEQAVEVMTASGARFTASYAVSTLPLGVMQRHSAHLFDPPLPPRKTQSLAKVGMGLLDKVILVYDQAWWTRDAQTAHTIIPASASPDDTLLPGSKPSAMFFLAHTSKPELCLFIGGSRGRVLETLSDDAASRWAHDLAASSLPAAGQRATPPIKTHVTRWAADPFSLGSYAYLPASTGASPLDMIELSRSIWDDRLGFAGEATEHDLFASAHGAYVSGEREARRILGVVAEKAAET